MEEKPSTLSEIGRALAAARRMHTRQCIVCGKQVTGTGKRKYCGNTCAQRAHYRRVRGLPIADTEHPDSAIQGA